ncbi:MAG: aldehyde dehydrogenase family protein [Flavobacteriia bacterium]|nr:MAG: aldehyde dehydrogenase family protein [Flavobacteriia bacterium]
MSKGFRTFQAAQNTWDTQLYFPTPPSFLKDWEARILPAQAQFGSMPTAQRAELLLLINDNIVAHQNLIKALYIKESGLSAARFEAEFKRLTQTILLFAEHIQKMPWEKQAELPHEAKTLLKKRLPIGPVLVLGSSNFPLAYSTMGGDTVAALAAGCCVVLKAHPMHVGTSTAVANCVTRALDTLGLPSAIFSHVIDNTYHWAGLFAQHAHIQAIGFTGSIKGGRALMDLAAQRPAPIPVFAEMGSLNPVLILADYPTDLLAVAAEKLASSICTDAGQFCTKPGLLLVHESHFEHFKKALLSALGQQAAVPMLHPDIYQKFEARKRQVFQLKGLVQYQTTQNAQGLLGRWALVQSDLTQLLQEPTLRDEVFGPFAVLCSFSTEAQLGELFEVLGGQLTCSVFSAVPAQISPVLQNTLSQKAGRVILNGVPTGVSVDVAMHHGGPYPASSDVRFSAVGPDSILRFTKEVCWQFHH